MKKITVSHVLITTAILVVISSLILPVYLYVVGISCNSLIQSAPVLFTLEDARKTKEPELKQLAEEKKIKYANCATPRISYGYGTDEYKKFTFEYKKLVRDYFGNKLAGTTTFLILYILGVIGAAFFVFKGNPFVDTWRAIAGIGLIFVDTIFLVMAFSFFFQELIEMDGLFMINSLTPLLAVVGIAIYLLVFYVRHRRQQRLERLSTTLENELNLVYLGKLPQEVVETRLNARENLLLASEYLSKNVRFLFMVDEIHSKTEVSLHQIESNALKQVEAEIDKNNSRITEALRSAFTSTHVDPDQVKSVFFKLVRTSNHNVLSDYIRKMDIRK